MMAAMLAGCGGRAVIGLGVAAEPAASAAVVPVYVATTRARSQNLSLPYSAERSQTLNLARFDVAIPKNHAAGQVETAAQSPNPARHFTALDYQRIAGRKQFVADLDAALAQRPVENREIFIFVHGYNNNFADSLFRAA
ncbi:alpha/beta hydrolase, partial [Rhizobiaceae sp. 2RAB30]